MLIEQVGVPARYERQFLIGKGSFGDVYKGVRLSDGLIVAMKEVRRSSIRDQHLLQKSITRERTINELLGKLHCPYFVEFLDYVEEEESVCFVYEFCEGQTLQALTSGKTHQQKQNFLLLAMYQILLVLQLLKKHQLLHRDIKPENVLINKGVAKIADFGLARELSEDALTRGVGSSLTTAPEVYTERYSYECDVWSLALTVHRCLFEVYPFDRETLQLVDEASVKRRIALREFKIVVNNGSKLSPLLLRMLEVEPDKRVSVETILSESPFRLEFRYSACYLSNFRSNNASLRNCLLLMSRLHFSGISGATASRAYIVTMTALVAFSQSVMIYKECKFTKVLRVEAAGSRLLVGLLMLLLAAELNTQAELKQLLEFMLVKHGALEKELRMQLHANHPNKASRLQELQRQLHRAPLLPRFHEVLKLSDGDSTLLEILGRNQRFRECIQNIDSGSVKFVYKFYYEEIAEFHRCVELI